MGQLAEQRGKGNGRTSFHCPQNETGTRARGDYHYHNHTIMKIWEWPGDKAIAMLYYIHHQYIHVYKCTGQKKFGQNGEGVGEGERQNGWDN